MNQESKWWRRRDGAILFLAALLFYVGTAPGFIPGTYATESLDAARGLLDRGSMRVPQPWSSGRPAYPRHGVVEAALDVPVVLVARLVGDGDPATEEWLVSLVPSAFTALLVAVLYRWCLHLGASRRRALAVALTAAVCTMLWPYTAIGLEPALSGSVLAAGYSICVFGSRGGIRWPLLAGLGTAIAAGVKETGLLALPAMSLLFVETWATRAERRASAWLAFAAPVATSLAIFAVTRREGVDVILGGSLRTSAAASGWQVLFGIWGQLASPNKGLVFYAPAAIVALAAWPHLYRSAPRVARWVFALALITVTGMGTRSFWAEETWGPRYDHVLVGPLMLSLAVLSAGPRLLRRWKVAWVVAAVGGAHVALVGHLFWYGHLFGVMQRAGASELSRIQYDPTWNPIEFQTRLLGYRLGLADATFRPLRRWWFAVPSQENISIGDYAQFQPLILYEGGTPSNGGRVVPGARALHLAALLAGLALYGVVIGTVLREARSPGTPRG